MTFEGGAVSTPLSSSDSTGSNRAAVLVTRGRFEVGRTWYCPTSLRVFDNNNKVIESFDISVQGCGMQFQATGMERLIADRGTSILAPRRQSIAIMTTVDEVRRQIGLTYPQET